MAYKNTVLILYLCLLPNISRILPVVRLVDKLWWDQFYKNFSLLVFLKTIPLDVIMGTFYWWLRNLLCVYNPYRFWFSVWLRNYYNWNGPIEIRKKCQYIILLHSNNFCFHCFFHCKWHYSSFYKLRLYIWLKVYSDFNVFCCS